MKSPPVWPEYVQAPFYLPDEPWWTEADQAEFAVHVKEFLDVVFLHKEWCLECQGIYSWCKGRRCWCDDLLKAFQQLMDWRQARILVSKAEWLRVQQDIQRGR